MHANPDGAERLRRARAQGKRIILCSDMYLPSPVIRDLLRSCGYDGDDPLYVSCEQAASKHLGTLFGRITEATGIAAGRILHTGRDDRHSDVSDGGARRMALPAHAAAAEPACRADALDGRSDGCGDGLRGGERPRAPAAAGAGGNRGRPLAGARVRGVRPAVHRLPHLAEARGPAPAAGPHPAVRARRAPAARHAAPLPRRGRPRPLLPPRLARLAAAAEHDRLSARAAEASVLRPRRGGRGGAPAAAGARPSAARAGDTLGRVRLRRRGRPQRRPADVRPARQGAASAASRGPAPPADRAGLPRPVRGRRVRRDGRRHRLGGEHAGLAGPPARDAPPPACGCAATMSACSRRRRRTTCPATRCTAG